MGSLADPAFRGCRSESPGVVGSGVKDTLSSEGEILDEYLKALQDERSKIEAFKRELPHCIQLLDFAIDSSKENLAIHSPSTSPGHPLLPIIGNTPKTLGLFGKEIVQGFLKTSWETVRKDDSEEEEKEKARPSSSRAEGDRPIWMAEAQSWSQTPLKSHDWKEKESPTEDSVRRKQASPSLLFNAKQRPGGAFVPFVKEKPVPSPVNRSEAGVAADFMLSSAAIGRSNGGGGGGGGGGSTYSGGTGSTTAGDHSGGNAAQRKARRCWSPELHRRFVSALHQLGGSQTATPKQIRELMKVDGLTNDEVKSHLQKYRLHTRRPSPTQQGPPQTSPQLVVLGGIWVPPQCGNAGMYHHDPSRSLSQQEPIFCKPSGSQEFYSQLHPVVQTGLHRSPSHSSPEGPLQSTSNLSSVASQIHSEIYRDDSGGEDGKSESSSWEGEDNSRGNLEKEIERKNVKGVEDEDDDEDDTEEADVGSDDGSDCHIRLQLEMSCSSVQGLKRPS